MRSGEGKETSLLSLNVTSPIYQVVESYYIYNTSIEGLGSAILSVVRLLTP